MPVKDHEDRLGGGYFFWLCLVLWIGVCTVGMLAHNAGTVAFGANVFGTATLGIAMYLLFRRITKGRRTPEAPVGERAAMADEGSPCGRPNGCETTGWGTRGHELINEFCYDRDSAGRAQELVVVCTFQRSKIAAAVGQVDIFGFVNFVFEPGLVTEEGAGFLRMSSRSEEPRACAVRLAMTSDGATYANVVERSACDHLLRLFRCADDIELEVLSVGLERLLRAPLPLDSSFTQKHDSLLARLARG